MFNNQGPILLVFFAVTKFLSLFFFYYFFFLSSLLFFFLLSSLHPCFFSLILLPHIPYTLSFLIPFFPSTLPLFHSSSHSFHSPHTHNMTADEKNQRQQSREDDQEYDIEIPAGVAPEAYYDSQLSPLRASLRRLLLPYIRAETPILHSMQVRLGHEQLCTVCK